MITETDKRFHPWPPDGKHIEFRWREAVVVNGEPFYGAKDTYKDLTPDNLKWFYMRKKRTWFLTVNNKFFHFYLGYQPIPVGKGDPGFYWQSLGMVQNHVKNGELFVEAFIRSFRWGIGRIS